MNLQQFIQLSYDTKLQYLNTLNKGKFNSIVSYLPNVTKSDITLGIYNSSNEDYSFEILSFCILEKQDTIYVFLNINSYLKKNHNNHDIMLAQYHLSKDGLMDMQILFEENLFKGLQILNENNYHIYPEMQENINLFLK